MKTGNALLLALGLCVTSVAYGQVRTEISVREQNNSAYTIDDQTGLYNAHNFSVGFGLGSSKVYGDLAHSNPQPVYIGYFEKNLGPTISYGWTVSVGDMSARDPKSHLRSFNHFTSVDQHITVELGTLFSAFDREYYDNMLLRVIGGVYGGVGLGIINNDIKRIASLNDNLAGSIKTNNAAMVPNSTSLYIPMNVGFNLHVPKFWKFKGCVFNANYQYSMTMSDYIDGYRPNFSANKKNDVYTVMSVGFRFFILHPAEY